MRRSRALVACLGCCSWEQALGTDDRQGDYPEGFLPPKCGAQLWAAKKAPPAPVVVEWAP